MISMPLTWCSALAISMLGVAYLQIPPSIPTTFPLVRALLGCSGESDALMTRCKTPGQRTFSDKVELGGIEPTVALFLGVAWLCSVLLELV